jgi:hypothetical protein
LKFLINSKKGDEDMAHFYAEIQGNKGIASVKEVSLLEFGDISEDGDLEYVLRDV